MLYLAIPAHNEVATIGVLLWRLRTVLAEFPREYEVVVYDDASTDETAAVAEQYIHAMPVTVLRGAKPIGYAGAVNALVRHIAAHTRYPRRDAMLLLQGDFTDPPGIVPEFARRFEGGADVVVGERTVVVDAPLPVRRLFSASGWALRPFVRVEGVRDLTGSMRLMRISALRDLLRTVGDDAVCAGDSWTANADLLLRLVPHARRVETVPVEPTYGVRTRDTRRVTVRDALAALRWGWRARGRRAVPTSAPEAGAETAGRSARPTPPSRRRDEPEVTADRLRERSRDRERLRGDVDGAPSRRDGRAERDRQKAERHDRKRHEKSNEKSDEKPVETLTERSNEKRNDAKNGKRGGKRQQVGEQLPMAGRDDQAAEPRSPRQPRAERQRRRGRNAPLDADAELIDPFAAPSARGGSMPSAPSSSSVESVNAEEERSPYAEPTTSPRSGSNARDVPRDDSGDRNRGGLKDERAIDDVNDDDADDNLDDPETAVNDGVVGDDATLDARERKRRRNRRSRRRRSKQRGDTAEAGSEHAVPADASNDGPSPYRGAHDADAAGLGDNAVDGESHDGDDGDDDSASDTIEAGGEGSDKERAARARRRGRRGRRGGSRRSRARGRDGADGASPAGDEPSAPPPPASSGDSE